MIKKVFANEPTTLWLPKSWPGFLFTAYCEPKTFRGADDCAFQNPSEHTRFIDTSNIHGRPAHFLCQHRKKQLKLFWSDAKSEIIEMGKFSIAPRRSIISAEKLIKTQSSDIRSSLFILSAAKLIRQQRSFTNELISRKILIRRAPRRKSDKSSPTFIVCNSWPFETKKKFAVWWVKWKV